MIDTRIILYDYANGVSYLLEDRGVYDYSLRYGATDGFLYVEQTEHPGGALVSRGRLAFVDGCIETLPPDGGISSDAGQY